MRLFQHFGRACLNPAQTAQAKYRLPMPARGDFGNLDELNLSVSKKTGLKLKTGLTMPIVPIMGLGMPLRALPLCVGYLWMGTNWLLCWICGKWCWPCEKYKFALITSKYKNIVKSLEIIIYDMLFEMTSVYKAQVV